MPGLFWSRFKNYLYDKKFSRTIKPDCYAIGIGNITWGGTGKTSLVIGLTQELQSQGLHVAILSRGYHRETAGPLVVSDGTSLLASWRESGDEAHLLARTLPSAIVVVAEKRSEGLLSLEPFSPDVLLLDDAFQHREIERDLDIVLVDASEDITGQKVIPFGKLREEPRSLQRADVVILTHQKKADKRTQDWIGQNISRPVFHANYVVEEDLSIHGKKIGAFCAIGAPQHFFELLREEGADLVATKSYRDHYVFTHKEILAFRENAASKGAECIVTTSKDAVRLNPAWLDPFIKVARVKLQIVEESLFFGLVMNRLNQSGKQSQVP